MSARIDTLAECKAKHPGPCVRIMAADFKTVTETFDCVVWCPVLNRRIEDDDNAGGIRGAHSG